MQETGETWVQLLCWEDPLEEDVETHSSILAWRIPWTEEPGGLQSTGSQRVGQDRSDWSMHRSTDRWNSSNETALCWVLGIWP